MPNGTEFPKFPTLFTEEDAKRLQELEEQKKRMEEVYQAKFTTEAWAKVTPPEKAVRGILPPWLSPVAKAVTPWEWGWEYGFTPEQAQEERFELEDEYKELVRKQKVTRLLSPIKNTLRALALSGETVTDASELRSIFKLGELNFNEDEIGYVMSFAQRLLWASPEEIASGEIFEMKPLSPGDVEELARLAIEPRYVLTTVSLSKNLEDITAALQEMYAPQVDTSRRAEIIREYAESLKGITKESSKELFEKIAKEEGEVLVLTNEQTGEMFNAKKKSDNTVWIEDELIGFYYNGRIVPIDLDSGQPLATEEEQESKFKDLWDSFYLGTHQAWHGTGQGILNVLKEAITPKTLKGVEIGTEGFPGQRKLYQNLQLAIDQTFERNELINQEWLKEHPELVPRPEYTQDPFKHTELFRDPYYYAYTMISNAPIIGAALAVGLVTTLATKNPVAGAVAGAAVITPVQINSVYEDLIANGADPANANELAVSVGTLIGAVEIVPGMIALKAISPLFMRVFKQNLQKEITKQVTKRLMVKGILAIAGKIEIAETLEEVIQEAMQNAAVKTVNENRSIVENLPQVAVNTLIAVFPLALFGGGAQYVGMKANLPPKVREEIDTTATKMKEAGLSPEHAEAVAVAKVMETETGQAQIELAVERTDGEILTVKEKPSKIVYLETKLTVTNEDIDTFASSIEIQEERLKKMKASGEAPSEQLAQVSTITDLKENLLELEVRKLTIEKQLKKLKKAIPLVVPEVTAEQLWSSMEVTERTTWVGQTKLSGKVASKDWVNLTEKQQKDLLVARAEVKIPITPPAVEIAPEHEATPLAEPEERNTTPDKRPRIQDWEDERELVEAAFKANPNVFKAVKISKAITEARESAERTLEGLHSDLEGTEDVEAKKEIEKKLKDIAKEAGLGRKTLLTKHWDDLTPPEQQALTLTAIPEGSIHFPVSKELFDVRYYMQFLQEMTGIPFYEVFKRAEISHGAARHAGEDMLTRIGGDPFLTKVRTSKESLVRVTQHINSKNPRLNVSPIEDMTHEELLLTDAVEDILSHYEPYVRFLRVEGTDPDMDSFKAEFPDAVEAGKEVELALALELKKKGDLDGLFLFLKDVAWGTVVGYTPWMKAKASIFPPSISLGTTRGAARLMKRDSIDFDRTLGENLLLDIAKYIKQIEAQWRIRPEMVTLQEMWKDVSSKFDNKGQVEGALREWSGELQGIPTRQSFLDSVLRRVWRQAMSAVFLHPWMAFRNMHQALAFHPDRTELFRLLFKVTPMPADIKVKSGIYFDVFVSQLKGIRREWLYMGERGLPGLGWLTRLSDRMSLYSHSDNLPRRWSFEAGVNKARRAVDVYMASSKTEEDIAKWLRDSGANHLRQTERNYALQLLTQPTHDLAVPGLREVSGAEMSSFYIGHEVANMTHFIYERAFRAPVELGATGRTLYNLIVFPRGYFQRMSLQAEKVFAKDTTWEQAKVGFKDIILIIIVGIMVSEWIRTVTGRPRRSYNPADIIQWQLGGLVIGVGMDLTKLISDLVVALDPTVDEEFKRDVLSRLPGELIRSADVLIPFYRNFMDSIEAATDTRNIDVHFLREMRALFDESYIPEEVEVMDRKLWEKFRKAILAGEPPDLTAFQQIQKDLLEEQARLGEMDAQGNFYTLRQFGGTIKSLTKPLPDDMLTEEYNFPELVVFYKECEDEWKEMYKFPTTPSSVRTEWRESHIEGEAMLLFWGMYAKSVYRRGSPEWEQVSNLLRTWFSYYSIDKRMHSAFADWTVTRGLTIEE